MRGSLPRSAIASVTLAVAALAACATAPAEQPVTVTMRPAKARPEAARDDTPCSRASVAAPALGAVSLRGTREADACKSLRSRAGIPLDEAVTEADIRELFAMGRFADVTAVVEESDGAPPVLVFELKELPRVASVTFTGAPEGFDARALMGVRPVHHEPSWVRAADERLAEALREAGYRKAVVNHEVVLSGDGAVAVSFAITPGARVVLGAVRFEGLTTAPLERVRAGLALTPGEPAPEMVIERDTLMVSNALYDLGLVESEVKSRIEENFLASRFDVVFTVTEGPAYRLRDVKVSGSNLLPKGRYEKLLATLPRGTLFVRSKVAAAVQAVEHMHRDAGVARRVEVRTTLDAKRHVIDVDIRVE